MAIRTPEEYRQSLRDGRRVYIFGEKVEDVTTHPILKIGTETAAGDYVLTESEDPAIRDLFVAQHPETGEPISRYFATPKTPEDIEMRMQMAQRPIRLTGGLPLGQDIRTDSP